MPLSTLIAARQKLATGAAPWDAIRASAPDPDTAGIVFRTIERVIGRQCACDDLCPCALVDWCEGRTDVELLAAFDQAIELRRIEQRGPDRVA
jgi:hypothetical protein